MPTLDPLIRPHREPDLSTSRVAPRAAGQLKLDLGLPTLRVDKPALGFTVQQPVLSAAVALADALGISLTQLAGQISYELDLTGDWWAGWQTWKDGEPRIDTHTLEISQRGEILQLLADRATPVAEGSYRWQGELRLWDNEALLGWYRSIDQAVRSKGTLYLALHPDGDHAWGRWVGMSYDGLVISGWGSLARTQEQANQIVQDLIDKQPS